MPQRRYLDFDLLLERAGTDAYSIRVVRSPAGESSAADFTFPLSALETENFLLRVGRPRHGATRRKESPETEAAKTFGGHLYRALFRDERYELLWRSLTIARDQDAGLRIRLRMSDCPELAQLPWEYLYDQRQNRFLGLSANTPVVRYLHLPDPPRPLTVEPPLNVLVMIADPVDEPRLAVEHEWTSLCRATADLATAGRIALHRLKNGTLAALRQELRRGTYHVFHFIGHGAFDRRREDGVLVCEDQHGRSREVSGEEIGTLLHDHAQLRLAVLNACEGARSDSSDPFAGVAQSLIQQGMPAVIAMQFEITDVAAITFAEEFYAGLADGCPVDEALTEARKGIYNDRNSLEWATPVLHLRAPDGVIFAVTTEAVGAVRQERTPQDQWRQVDQHQAESPHKTVGAAPGKALAELAGDTAPVGGDGTSWHARIRTETKSPLVRATVAVLTLTHETHVLVARFGLRDMLELDGTTIFRSLNHINGTHTFLVSDGDRQLPAEVQLTSSGQLRYTFERIVVAGVEVPKLTD